MQKRTKASNKIEPIPSEPVPIEKNVPAGEVNTTVIQAAIDDRFKKNEETLKTVNNLMLVGFFVLLVMVATLILSAFTDYKNSVSEYRDLVNQLQNDRYQLLQERISFLEFLSTSSAIKK